MENANVATLPTVLLAPPLAVPDATTAQRAAARWLRAEIGDACYPAEASFDQ